MGVGGVGRGRKGNRCGGEAASSRTSHCHRGRSATGAKVTGATGDSLKGYGEQICSAEAYPGASRGRLVRY